MTASKKTRHALTVSVGKRDANSVALIWVGTCKCKAVFAEATFEEADDAWRMHYYADTGEVATPFGKDTGNRWQPAASTAEPLAVSRG